MIADVITPIPTKRFRASQFIPSAMLREAKNRAIVAIQLSGRHASAWIGGIDAGMNARPPSPFRENCR
jgi:hypothetical protein